MNDEELSKMERLTIRIFLAVVLIWLTLVLYQGCSATFIKGHHNNSSSAEQVEADGDELELMGRHKKGAAIEWIQNEKECSLVEKKKSNFAGCEIRGKTLGVIGLGAIGAMVANNAIDLGMNVIGYDPYLSVDGALMLSNQIRKVNSLDGIYAGADYITIHVPLLDSTKDMINSESLAKCKEGLKLINFSRGGLVNSDDILKAIENGKVSTYVTDFPENKLLGKKGIIPIPHLGASTAESEENCAVMAVDEIKEYLENGNIINSVNFPNASLPRTPGATRIVIANENIPSMIENITSKLAKNNLNIVDMLNKSRDNIAYNIIDVAGEVDSELSSRIESLESVIFARIIR